ncbi:MAG: hypothetical protein HYV27_02770 [Candidatus Hydrogenedentes bacterium]|nr:hypothetical protein [Candidatus Hydrogenedentota bacterium]
MNPTTPQRGRPNRWFHYATHIIDAVPFVLLILACLPAIFAVLRMLLPDSY